MADKDGILDPLCSDTKGQLWGLLSSKACADGWNKITNQDQDDSKVCKRPSGWCHIKLHEGSTFTMTDYDRDGVPDPMCSDTKGKLWGLLSSKGCSDPWTAL